MENQIYRIKIEGNKTLEFYICDTNKIEPNQIQKEMGIVLLSENLQLHGSLNKAELSSLIDYLENCKDCISRYNKSSE